MNPEKTVVETQKVLQEDAPLSKFKDYKILKELPPEGSESDIFIIEKKDILSILKLYRKGIHINKKIIEKIKKLSRNNNNIIKIIEYGFDENTGKNYEILEYATYGSLNKFFEEKPADKNQIRTLVEQLNEALYQIHQEGIVHKDLKPSNILVKSNSPLIFAISDFGISTKIRNNMTKKITQMQGTPMYYAPESFSGIVGKEIDYWALGMIILEALHKNPFKGLDVKTIMFKITSEGVTIADSIDSHIKKLLKGLLTQNRKYRWGYKEVKNWLEGNENKIYYTYKEKHGKYSFLNNNFSSIQQLVEYAVENKENYIKFITFLKKRYLNKQLYKNNEMDLDLQLENILSKETDDLFLGIMAQKILSPDSTPKVYGIPLNKPTIVKIMFDYIKGEPLTEEEKNIIYKIQNKNLRLKLIKCLQDKEVEFILNAYIKMLSKLKNKKEALLYTLKTLNKDYIVPHKVFNAKKEEIKVVMQNLIKKEDLLRLNEILSLLNYDTISEKEVKDADIIDYLRLYRRITEIPNDLNIQKLKKEFLALIKIKTNNEDYVYPENINEINSCVEKDINKRIKKALDVIDILNNKENIKPIKKEDLKRIKKIYGVFERNGLLSPFELVYVANEKFTLSNWEIFYKNVQIAKRFIKERKKEIEELV